jgi:hypothetical protein
MKNIDYLVVLGDVILGQIVNNSGNENDWQFVPYIQHSPAADILAGNRYKGPLLVYYSAAMLLPVPCREHTKLLRRENGQVKSTDDWSKLTRGMFDFVTGQPVDTAK